MRLLALVLLALVTCGFAIPYVGRQPDVAQRATLERQTSRALGTPSLGRLVRGVQLPGEGMHYFTWDPLLHRRPDRAWRRWGTDRLVRILLRVIATYAREHPEAPRVGVGDLSRPHGGPFGPRHASHQNGLDVDIYYPRRDRWEQPPQTVDQIDHRLAQALVDLFVRAGAELVFVGPNVGLNGPARVVQVLWNHDNHLHVRIYNPARAVGSPLP